jgi:aryl-alcohol dehydrogenase-like predicted oxidoreductase
MPLQFGLLTGKFNEKSVFEENDHRSLRLTPDLISELLNSLKFLEPIIEKYKVNKTTFALSFINSFSGISTIIPGMRNPEQIEQNICPLIKIEKEDLKFINRVFENNFNGIVDKMN